VNILPGFTSSYGEDYVAYIDSSLTACIPYTDTTIPAQGWYYTAEIVGANDYYPFGSLMPGRKFTSGSYRYGFNGQEMNNDVKGIGNSYTAEFWEYDSRLGRRWNVDPKPTEGLSLYSAFRNNPIWFTDLRGDTTIIDDNGIVTRNDKNGDGLLFHSYTNKDEKGKTVSQLTRIYLNDKKIDAQQMDLFDVGKKLVRFLNEKEVNWILNKAGADDYVPGQVSDIRMTAEAYGAFDFGPNVLRPNIIGQDGAEGLTMTDPYPDAWNQNGGFIVYIGAASLRAYNIPDAGNFLFGAAAGRTGVPYLKLVVGAQLNSGMTGNGLDTKEDQSALAQGYLYSTHLKMVHRADHPWLYWYKDYDKKRPSWFDPKNDKTMIQRR